MIPCRHRYPGLARTLVLTAMIAFSAALSAGAAGEPVATTRDDLIDEAVEYLTYSNFDMAYQRFERLAADISQKEDGKAWERVTFGLALSAHYRTPPNAALIRQASTLYESILAYAPDSRFAPRCLMNLARIAEMRDYGGDVPDPVSARGLYREVFERWPQLDIADEAALRYADTFVQAFGNEDSIRDGVTFLEQWLAERQDRPMRSVIWEYLGQVRLVMLRDDAGAVDAFVRADELGLVDTGSAGEIYWNIATIAHHRIDDATLAVRYYRKIILQCPTSGRAFEAQLALRQLHDDYPAMHIDVPDIPRLLSPAADDEPRPADEAAAEAGS